MKLDTLNRHNVKSARAALDMASAQMETVVDLLVDLAQDHPEIAPYQKTAECAWELVMEAETILKTV